MASVRTVSTEDRCQKLPARLCGATIESLTATMATATTRSPSNPKRMMRSRRNAFKFSTKENARTDYVVVIDARRMDGDSEGMCSLSQATGDARFKMSVRDDSHGIKSQSQACERTSSLNGRAASRMKSLPLHRGTAPRNQIALNQVVKLTLRGQFVLSANISRYANSSSEPAARPERVVKRVWQSVCSAGGAPQAACFNPV